MTTLLVYLDPSGADAAYPWALRALDGRVQRRGADAARALPKARECVIVLPWHRSTIHRVRLPAARRDRLQGALHFAIENELLAEPAATYVAIAGQDAAGLATLVSTDRLALEALLHALRENGVQPARMVAEVLTVPVQPRNWSVVLRDDGGFVRSGPHGGFSLDVAAADLPPVQLRLSLADARAAASVPARMRICRTAGGGDLAPWREALGVPVEEADPWSWEAADLAASPDLLQGDLRPRTDRLEMLRPWIPAGILAAAIVALHVAFTLLHWAVLSWESASLTRDMEIVFRQAVPDAQAVVNPPLQMRRIVADLQRASGALAADDFLALLGRVAPEIQRASGASVRMIEYTSGVLRVDLLVPKLDVAVELVQRLGNAGLHAKLENSSASGKSVLTRISVGAAAR